MTRTLDQTTEKGKQMTEDPQEGSTGAPFHAVTDWHAIDWKSANHNVRRLQARIVKATQEKKWGKVKALQRLLTHSFSGKALAVRRVTENQGKHTPGVDKIIWNTPHKKINAVYSLRQRDYHPQPLRRIYILKKNGKKRALGIPVMKCRAMQALYLLALDPVAENHSGSQLVRFPTTEIDGGCDRTVLHGPGKPPLSAMDTRRRHQRLFRRHFS